MSKRYEKMPKEQIMRMFLCAEKQYSNPDARRNCIERIYEYLHEEEPKKTIPRFSLIKSPEDLDKLSEEWKDYCDHRYCVYCKYLIRHGNGGSSMCFAEYLKEEIEVEDE